MKKSIYLLASIGAAPMKLNLPQSAIEEIEKVVNSDIKGYMPNLIEHRNLDLSHAVPPASQDAHNVIRGIQSPRADSLTPPAKSPAPVMASEMKPGDLAYPELPPQSWMNTFAQNFYSHQMAYLQNLFAAHWMPFGGVNHAMPAHAGSMAQTDLSHIYNPTQHLAATSQGQHNLGNGIYQPGLSQLSVPYNPIFAQPIAAPVFQQHFPAAAPISGHVADTSQTVHPFQAGNLAGGSHWVPVSNTMHMPAPANAPEMGMKDPFPVPAQITDPIQKSYPFKGSGNFPEATAWVPVSNTMHLPAPATAEQLPASRAAKNPTKSTKRKLPTKKRKDVPRASLPAKKQKLQQLRAEPVKEELGKTVPKNGHSDGDLEEDLLIWNPKGPFHQ